MLVCLCGCACVRVCVCMSSDVGQWCIMGLVSSSDTSNDNMPSVLFDRDMTGLGDGPALLSSDLQKPINSSIVWFVLGSGALGRAFHDKGPGRGLQSKDWALGPPGSRFQIKTPKKRTKSGPGSRLPPYGGGKVHRRSSSPPASTITRLQ